MAGEIVLTDPFPHVWFDAGLPADLYAAAAWPSDEEIGKHLQVKPPRLVAREFRVEPGYTKYDGSPQGPGWEAVHVWCAETLTPQLLTLFAPWVEEHLTEVRNHSRWSEARVEDVAANHGRLMQRWPGYRLRPHVDLAPYAITVLHYFPSAGDEAEQSGTRLYAVSKPIPIRALDSTQTRYFDEFGIDPKLVKTMPWTANGCLAFPNTRRSAHGLFVKGPAPRRVFQWHVALPGAEAKMNFAARASFAKRG